MWSSPCTRTRSQRRRRRRTSPSTTWGFMKLWNCTSNMFGKSLWSKTQTSHIRDQSYKPLFRDAAILDFWKILINSMSLHRWDQSTLELLFTVCKLIMVLKSWQHLKHCQSVTKSFIVTIPAALLSGSLWQDDEQRELRHQVLQDASRWSRLDRWLTLFKLRP